MFWENFLPALPFPSLHVFLFFATIKAERYYHDHIQALDQVLQNQVGPTFARTSECTIPLPEQVSAQHLCQNKGGETDVNGHRGIRSVTVVEGDQRAAGQLGDLQWTCIGREFIIIMEWECWNNFLEDTFENVESRAKSQLDC